MVFKYFRKGFLKKLEIHVWCKKNFLDELVLMLFGAAADFFSKKYCLVKTIKWVGQYVRGVGEYVVGLGGEGEERGWLCVVGVGVRK